jgi:hypothetical protein
LKIDGTVLAKIISEEPGNEHLRKNINKPISKPPQKPVNPEKVKQLAAEAPDIKQEVNLSPEAIEEMMKAMPLPGSLPTAMVADGGIEEVKLADDKTENVQEMSGVQGQFDLYTHLKQELLKEGKQQPKETKVEVEPQLVSSSSEDLSDELKPYTTDLEYLTDNFAAISMKVH